jgi:hypothetical protein
VKKINPFKNPFLYGSIIDVLGYAVVVSILVWNNCFGEHFFVSLGLAIALCLLVVYRGMFTSTSFSMMKHVKLLRVLVFNLNADIKITKLYVKVFGQRRLYERRASLLREQKRRAKMAYKNLVNLTELMWRGGYDSDLLIFIMTVMLRINDEVKRLSKRYRLQTQKRKRMLDKSM